MKRREFTKFIGCTALGSIVSGIACEKLVSKKVNRPNILWISAEDISPDLGCYGDDYAVTPTLDQLAGEGCRYDRAFVPFPVCAPTRSAIITGMFPGTIGSMHMRTKNKDYECVPPPHVKCFTEYLRAAGYYCMNPGKTDYQFNAPFTAFDSAERDWNTPNKPKDMPFFLVLDHIHTHESRCWDIEKLDHDPNKVEVPPYYPDTPIVRRNLAKYYDNLTTLDNLVKDILDKLEADGLSKNTVVVFWGDHGRGLPRNKRWPYDGGLRVPLIIRWPGHIKPGTVNDELVNLIDLAPTMLSIAGAKIPETLQGRVLFGDQKGAEPEYLYGGRNRMSKDSDDFIRTIRDKRYRYIRNFTPDVPRAQRIWYRDDNMPIMKEWRRLHAEDKLDGPQKEFFLPTKPNEELYDTRHDPHNINNLADSVEHQQILKRMRAALDNIMKEKNDLGGIPEDELIESMWPGGKQPETDIPVIKEVPAGDGKVLVTLNCRTEGASIGYRIADNRWLLYSEPFTMKKSVSLSVKAIRYGYKESLEVKQIL